eukprot:1341687-Amphidinium_carterae.1
MLSQVLQTTLLIGIASGYTLVPQMTCSLDLLKWTVALVCLLHVMLVGGGKLQGEDANKHHEYEGGVGTILLVLRLALFAWFISSLRRCQAIGGIRLEAFLQRFACAGSVYFLSYPCLCLVTQATSGIPTSNPYKASVPLPPNMRASQQSSTDVTIESGFSERCTCSPHVQTSPSIEGLAKLHFSWHASLGIAVIVNGGGVPEAVTDPCCCCSANHRTVGGRRQEATGNIVITSFKLTSQNCWAAQIQALQVEERRCIGGKGSNLAVVLLKWIAFLLYFGWSVELFPLRRFAFVIFVFTEERMQQRSKQNACFGTDL